MDADPPTIAQRATHFASAMKEWAGSGFTTLTFEAFDSRRSVCMSCEMAGTVNGHFVGCKKCGCTALKLFLPGEKCPMQKW
jgi:hypothetical protein